MKKLITMVALVAVLAIGVAIAQAHWVGKVIYGDGTWKVMHTGVTYAPGHIDSKQSSGPCNNWRVGLFDSGNNELWSSGVHTHCPVNYTFTDTLPVLPDPYPGTTYTIKIVAAGTGQQFGYYVNERL